MALQEEKPQYHFSALDGLRGLMAIGVVVAHINLAWFPGAHIMMDVFFVISAFLITLTLIRGLEKRSKIHLRLFWQRRLLRLYPALLTVVITYSIIAAFFIDNLVPIFSDGIMSLLYVSNFNKLHDYTLPHFFGHTWSLSIEEQFYLAWPTLLVLLLKIDALWERKTLVFLSIIVASISWRVYLVNSGAEWSRLYYGSDTRIDAFLAGGLLAFYWKDLVEWSKQKRFFLKALQFSTFALFAAIIFWNPKVVAYFAWQQPIILLLSCGAIITLTRDKNGLLQRFFSHKIPASLGIRCYGLYLWHWPLIWLLLVLTDLSKPVLFAIVVPATLILTWLTYKYIEEPILKRRPTVSFDTKQATR